ncbi:IS91 family transposase [soil metagenome]
MTPTPPAPALELADVIRRHGEELDKDGPRPLTGEERRVLRSIVSCRTAALGGHVETCDHCRHRRIAYNSCRNRHCPKCQASACARWVEARASELLPVEYFHVVFTLPDGFNSLALSNKRVVYGVLFDAVAQTLLEVAADRRHLGAKIGFVAILHTWGQNLGLHPHVHCVIPGGGLSADGQRWISCRRGFFLPVRVLSRVFRGKFIDLLRRAFRAEKVIGIPDAAGFERLVDSAVRTDWVVYAKPPFGGPEQVLKYLSRYTHRIAISNRRLLAMDDQSVTFRWNDYAHGNRPRSMTLSAAEFLRRFLMHVVPSGFVRIRHFGLLANRARREKITLCRTLLAAASSRTIVVPAPSARLVVGTGVEDRCPECHRGRMIAGEWIAPARIASIMLRIDTS